VTEAPTQWNPRFELIAARQSVHDRHGYGPEIQRFEAAVRAVALSDAIKQLRLMGVGEVCAHLGVKMQRVHVLRERPDFPAPIATLRCGVVWRAEDIEKYAAQRKRTPGRPRKQP
jgi:predicted DNA-binding transcriptional regulator AlpA